MNSALLRLVACNGLLLVNNVAFIAVNGLAGLALAPQGWMATLPIMAYVAGGALAAGLVGRHQQRFGRRRTFQIGLLVALGSVLACALAVWLRSFALLVAATLVAGYYNANGALYRFAATELVPPERKARALSWVMTGGILGAVGGPNLAAWGKDALPGVPFAGVYLGLAVVALLALAVMSTIPFPPLTGQGSGAGAASAGRPTSVILRQPLFVIATACCAIGYGVMNLLMAATPIAMAQVGHPFAQAAFVLEWHVLGMFVPSFFTGRLIERFGVQPVLLAGLLLNAGCVLVALSGLGVAHFTLALALLGVGWNFLYVGGSTLALEAWRPEERTRAQAALDTTVYATMTLTSLASGALVTTGGWRAMNLGTLPVLALLAVALVALARERAAARVRGA